MRIKELTWKQEHYYCGERRIGYIEHDKEEVFKPYSWYNSLSFESGLCDTEEEAIKALQESFRVFVNEIIEF